MATAAADAAATPPIGDQQQQRVEETAALRAELQLTSEQLAKERRRKEKLKAQIARQQLRLRDLESLAESSPSSPLATANARLAEEAAERREQAELLRRRLEAETARRDEELRQLQMQHAEEDDAAREALTKVSVSLEAAKMEILSLRQALSQEQLEAAERRAESERLRAGLAEAEASAAESERAWHEWADRQDGAGGRLRELRDANIRLQEKLASAESRLAGLRADHLAAAALADERAELAARLREQLAASEARAEALQGWGRTGAGNVGDVSNGAASPPGQPRPRASEQQLADIRQQLERAEAALVAASSGPSPQPPASPPPPVDAHAAVAEKALEATRAELAGARAELEEARGRLAQALESPARLRRAGEVAASAAGEGGRGGADGDAKRRPEMPEGGGGSDGWCGGGGGGGSVADWPVGGVGHSGLWRTSYCTDDLDSLRRACLSLAAQRDRLSGDCRHYRRLYEEERRLRRRLTEEVRRLNCSDGRARALLMMEADSPVDKLHQHRLSPPPTYKAEFGAASYANYLRHKYTVT